MLGMSSESVSTIRQFVAEQGVTFPILHDKSGVVRSLYRLSNALSPYPRDYIIDQEGVFRYTATEYHPQRMVGVVESLLGVSSDVEEENDDKNSAMAPDDYLLLQNYPNPFNASTIFSFELPKEEQTTLTVYNLNGGVVARVVDKVLPAGRHSVKWDGALDGRLLPSGVYFYRFETASIALTKKLSLVR